MRLVSVRFLKSSMATLRTHRAAAWPRRGVSLSYFVLQSSTSSGRKMRLRPLEKSSCDTEKTINTLNVHGPHGFDFGRNRTRRSGIVFLAYLLLFNATWTVWVLLGYPRLRAIGEQTLAYALINITVRALLWVLPVFLYLRYFDRVDPLAYLKLRQHWLRGVLIGLGVSVIILLLALVQHGAPHGGARGLTWNSVLSTSLLIGFVEEI